MVDTEIRLMIFFAATDGETLYSQQKQNWDMILLFISCFGSGWGDSFRGFHWALSTISLTLHV